MWTVVCAQEVLVHPSHPHLSTLGRTLSAHSLYLSFPTCTRGTCRLLPRSGWPDRSKYPEACSASTPRLPVVVPASCREGRTFLPFEPLSVTHRARSREVGQGASVLR